MSAKQHIIALSEDERRDLEQVSRSTRHGVREKTRVRVFWAATPPCPRQKVAEGGSQTDLCLAARYKVNPLTVAKVRQRAHERGALASIARGKQKNRKARRFDGVGEAQRIALTCSSPPDGCAVWTLRLLRERLIELEVVENIGMETLRQTLKNTRSNPG